jgi:hypothetical protein
LTQAGIFQAHLMDEEVSLGVLDLNVEETKPTNSVAA